MRTGTQPNIYFNTKKRIFDIPVDFTEIASHAILRRTQVVGVNDSSLLPTAAPGWSPHAAHGSRCHLRSSAGSLSRLVAHRSGRARGASPARWHRAPPRLYRRRVFGTLEFHRLCLPRRCSLSSPAPYSSRSPGLPNPKAESPHRQLPDGVCRSGTSAAGGLLRQHGEALRRPLSTRSVEVMSSDFSSRGGMVMNNRCDLHVCTTFA